MIDYSISELMQEKYDKKPSNSLILISEDSVFQHGNKLYFRPESATATIDGKTYDIHLTAIPIRKIESDQTLEEVVESIIIQRPNNNYIKANSINKSISWWITNNAEQLEYPDSVQIQYTSSDKKPRTMIFERVSKNKWDLVQIRSDSTPS